MLGQDGLDGPGGQAVPGHVDDVVGAAHHEQVPIRVEVAAVAGQVVAVVRRKIRRHVALVVAPQRGQGARRQRQLDADRALFVGVAHRAIRTQDLHVVTGHGHGRRAGLDRHGLQAHRIGRDGPAGLGLPPVVDDGDAELVGGPVVGVGIEPLTGLEQVLEPGQVVFADVRAVGVFLLDGADRRRCGEQRLDPVLGSHPPERARIGGADGLALVEHRGRTQQQGRVDDVGVPDDPPDVGGRPVHVARLHVVDVLHAPQQGHRVPAVVADDAFRLSGGARRVEHVQRVRGCDGYRVGGLGGGHQLLPVPVAALHQFARLLLALQDDACPRAVLGDLEGGVKHGFVLDNAGRLDSARGAHDDGRPGIIDPGGQFVRGESAEHHRVHGPEPRAGQHRDHGLGDHRHVHHDEIALANP